ncbi:MAG: hypothetical protein ACR2MU_08335 [Gaiellaceae bacterium]
MTPVEELKQRIERLAAERQDLRAAGVERDRLEENRQTLLQAQWSLSHALIQQYRPASA